MAPDSKNELERELTEIRKEVIESRNLVIKTDNLLKNLHAELKLVGKRQEDFQKRQWISSGVTYALVAVLCVAGAITIAKTSVSSVAHDRDRFEKSVTELTAQMEKMKSETSASQVAARAASEVYRMMTTLPGDQKLQGIDALAKLDTSKLSTLEKQALSDRAELLRKELGSAAFERGKTAFRRNDMQGTVQELSRFLTMNPSEADALDASFFLGAAYSQLRKHEQAIPLLERFVTQDRRAKTRDYAMMVLAASYEAMNQPDKAIELARDAIGTYPNSEFLPQLKSRLGSAKRSLAAASAAAGAEAAPAGTVPAAAVVPSPTPTAAAPAVANPAAPR